MIFQENISLKPFNSFGIDAGARYFARFTSVAELEEALEAAKALSGIERTAPLILGGGSNILFTKDFDGLVLKNELPLIEIIKDDDDYVYVKAGAGELWHQLVLFCLQHNLAGMENLSLIPGNVGASPMQNIGAYGVEIKDVFFSLEAYHLRDKQLITFDNAACEFGYRESVFKNRHKNEFVITSVTYRLKKVPVLNTSYGAIQQELERMGISNPSMQSVSQAVINIRRSKLPDPAEIGNAGSFFKNPEVSNESYSALQQKFPSMVGYDLRNGKTKLAAGWLIEQCGWTGHREGDAGCHDKQALVLVNFGAATGDQVLKLSDQIIASVSVKFGVELEREVNVV